MDGLRGKYTHTPVIAEGYALPTAAAPPIAHLLRLFFCFSGLSGQRKEKIAYLKHIGPHVMPLVRHAQAYVEHERTTEKEGEKKKKKKMAFPLLACVRRHAARRAWLMNAASRPFLSSITLTRPILLLICSLCALSSERAAADDSHGLV